MNGQNGLPSTNAMGDSTKRGMHGFGDMQDEDNDWWTSYPAAAPDMTQTGNTDALKAIPAIDPLPQDAIPQDVDSPFPLGGGSALAIPLTPPGAIHTGAGGYSSANQHMYSPTGTRGRGLGAHGAMGSTGPYTADSMSTLGAIDGHPNTTPGAFQDPRHAYNQRGRAGQQELPTPFRGHGGTAFPFLSPRGQGQMQHQHGALAPYTQGLSQGQGLPHIPGQAPGPGRGQSQEYMPGVGMRSRGHSQQAHFQGQGLGSGQTLGRQSQGLDGHGFIAPHSYGQHAPAARSLRRGSPSPLPHPHPQAHGHGSGQGYPHSLPHTQAQAHTHGHPHPFAHTLAMQSAPGSGSAGLRNPHHSGPTHPNIVSNIGGVGINSNNTGRPSSRSEGRGASGEGAHGEVEGDGAEAEAKRLTMRYGIQVVVEPPPMPANASDEHRRVRAANLARFQRMVRAQLAAAKQCREEARARGLWATNELRLLGQYIQQQTQRSAAAANEQTRLVNEVGAETRRLLLAELAHIASLPLQPTAPNTHNNTNNGSGGARGTARMGATQSGRQRAHQHQQHLQQQSLGVGRGMPNQRRGSPSPSLSSAPIAGPGMGNRGAASASVGSEIGNGDNSGGLGGVISPISPISPITRTPNPHNAHGAHGAYNQLGHGHNTLAPNAMGPGAYGHGGGGAHMRIGEVGALGNASGGSGNGGGAWSDDRTHHYAQTQPSVHDQGPGRGRAQLPPPSTRAHSAVGRQTRAHASSLNHTHRHFSAPGPSSRAQSAGPYDIRDGMGTAVRIRGVEARVGAALGAARRLGHEQGRAEGEWRAWSEWQADEGRRDGYAGVVGNHNNHRGAMGAGSAAGSGRESVGAGHDAMGQGAMASAYGSADAYTHTPGHGYGGYGSGVGQQGSVEAGGLAVGNNGGMSAYGPQDVLPYEQQRPHAHLHSQAQGHAFGLHQGHKQAWNGANGGNGATVGVGVRAHTRGYGPLPGMGTSVGMGIPVETPAEVEVEPPGKALPPPSPSLLRGQAPAWIDIAADTSNSRNMETSTHIRDWNTRPSSRVVRGTLVQVMEGLGEGWVCDGIVVKRNRSQGREAEIQRAGAGVSGCGGLWMRCLTTGERRLYMNENQMNDGALAVLNTSTSAEIGSGSTAGSLPPLPLPLPLPGTAVVPVSSPAAFTPGQGTSAPTPAHSYVSTPALTASTPALAPLTPLAGPVALSDAALPPLPLPLPANTAAGSATVSAGALPLPGSSAEGSAQAPLHAPTTDGFALPGLLGTSAASRAFPASEHTLPGLTAAPLPTAGSGQPPIAAVDMGLAPPALPGLHPSAPALDGRELPGMPTSAPTPAGAVGLNASTIDMGPLPKMAVPATTTATAPAQMTPGLGASVPEATAIGAAVMGDDAPPARLSHAHTHSATPMHTAMSIPGEAGMPPNGAMPPPMPVDMGMPGLVAMGVSGPLMSDSPFTPSAMPLPGADLSSSSALVLGATLLPMQSGMLPPFDPMHGTQMVLPSGSTQVPGALMSVDGLSGRLGGEVLLLRRVRLPIHAHVLPDTLARHQPLLGHRPPADAEPSDALSTTDNTSSRARWRRVDTVDGHGVWTYRHNVFYEYVLEWPSPTAMEGTHTASASAPGIATGILGGVQSSAGMPEADIANGGGDEVGSVGSLPMNAVVTAATTTPSAGMNTPDSRLIKPITAATETMTSAATPSNLASSTQLSMLPPGRYSDLSAVYAAWQRHCAQAQGALKTCALTRPNDAHTNTHTLQLSLHLQPFGSVHLRAILREPTLVTHAPQVSLGLREAVAMVLLAQCAGLEVNGVNVRHLAGLVEQLENAERVEVEACGGFTTHNNTHMSAPTAAHIGHGAGVGASVGMGLSTDIGVAGSVDRTAGVTPSVDRNVSMTDLPDLPQPLLPPLPPLPPLPLLALPQPLPSLSERDLPSREERESAGGMGSMSGMTTPASVHTPAHTPAHASIHTPMSANTPTIATMASSFHSAGASFSTSKSATTSAGATISTKNAGVSTANRSATASTTAETPLWEVCVVMGEDTFLRLDAAERRVGRAINGTLLNAHNKLARTDRTYQSAHSRAFTVRTSRDDGAADTNTYNNTSTTINNNISSSSRASNGISAGDSGSTIAVTNSLWVPANTHDTHTANGSATIGNTTGATSPDTAIRATTATTTYASTTGKAAKAAAIERLCRVYRAVQHAERLRRHVFTRYGAADNDNHRGSGGVSALSQESINDIFSALLDPFSGAFYARTQRDAAVAWSPSLRLVLADADVFPSDNLPPQQAQVPGPEQGRGLGQAQGRNQRSRPPSNNGSTPGNASASGNGSVHGIDAGRTNSNVISSSALNVDSGPSTTLQLLVILLRSITAHTAPPQTQQTKQPLALCAPEHSRQTTTSGATPTPMSVSTAPPTPSSAPAIAPALAPAAAGLLSALPVSSAMGDVYVSADTGVMSDAISTVSFPALAPLHVPTAAHAHVVGNTTHSTTHSEDDPIMLLTTTHRATLLLARVNARMARDLARRAVDAWETIKTKLPVSALVWEPTNATPQPGTWAVTQDPRSNALLEGASMTSPTAALATHAGVGTSGVGIVDTGVGFGLNDVLPMPTLPPLPSPTLSPLLSPIHTSSTHTNVTHTNNIHVNSTQGLSSNGISTQSLHTGLLTPPIASSLLSPLQSMQTTATQSAPNSTADVFLKTPLMSPLAPMEVMTIGADVSRQAVQGALDAKTERDGGVDIETGTGVDVESTLVATLHSQLATGAALRHLGALLAKSLVDTDNATSTGGTNSNSTTVAARNAVSAMGTSVHTVDKSTQQDTDVADHSLQQRAVLRHWLTEVTAAANLWCQSQMQILEQQQQHTLQRIQQLHSRQAHTRDASTFFSSVSSSISPADSSPLAALAPTLILDILTRASRTTPASLYPALRDAFARAAKPDINTNTDMANVDPTGTTPTAPAASEAPTVTSQADAATLATVAGLPPAAQRLVALSLRADEVYAGAPVCKALEEVSGDAVERADAAEALRASTDIGVVAAERAGVRVDAQANMDSAFGPVMGTREAQLSVARTALATAIKQLAAASANMQLDTNHGTVEADTSAASTIDTARKHGDAGARQTEVARLADAVREARQRLAALSLGMSTTPAIGEGSNEENSCGAMSPLAHMRTAAVMAGVLVPGVLGAAAAKARGDLRRVGGFGWCAANDVVVKGKARDNQDKLIRRKRDRGVDKRGGVVDLQQCPQTCPPGLWNTTQHLVGGTESGTAQSSVHGAAQPFARGTAQQLLDDEANLTESSYDLEQIVENVSLSNDVDVNEEELERIENRKVDNKGTVKEEMEIVEAKKTTRAREVSPIEAVSDKNKASKANDEDEVKYELTATSTSQMAPPAATGACAPWSSALHSTERLRADLGQLLRSMRGDEAVYRRTISGPTVSDRERGNGDAKRVHLQARTVSGAQPTLHDEDVKPDSTSTPPCAGDKKGSLPHVDAAKKQKQDGTMCAETDMSKVIIEEAKSIDDTLLDIYGAGTIDAEAVLDGTDHNTLEPDEDIDSIDRHSVEVVSADTKGGDMVVDVDPSDGISLRPRLRDGTSRIRFQYHQRQEVRRTATLRQSEVEGISRRLVHGCGGVMDQNLVGKDVLLGSAVPSFTRDPVTLLLRTVDKPKDVYIRDVAVREPTETEPQGHVVRMSGSESGVEEYEGESVVTRVYIDAKAWQWLRPCEEEERTREGEYLQALYRARQRRMSGFSSIHPRPQRATQTSTQTHAQTPMQITAQVRGQAPISGEGQLPPVQSPLHVPSQVQGEVRKQPQFPMQSVGLVDHHSTQQLFSTSPTRPYSRDSCQVYTPAEQAPHTHDSMHQYARGSTPSLVQLLATAAAQRVVPGLLWRRRLTRGLVMLAPGTVLHECTGADETDVGKEAAKGRTQDGIIVGGVHAVGLRDDSQVEGTSGKLGTPMTDVDSLTSAAPAPSPALTSATMSVQHSTTSTPAADSARTSTLTPGSLSASSVDLSTPTSIPATEASVQATIPAVEVTRKPVTTSTLRLILRPTSTSTPTTAATASVAYTRGRTSADWPAWWRAMSAGEGLLFDGRGCTGPWDARDGRGYSSRWDARMCPFGRTAGNGSVGHVGVRVRRGRPRCKAVGSIVHAAVEVAVGAGQLAVMVWKAWAEVGRKVRAIRRERLDEMLDTDGDLASERKAVGELARKVKGEVGAAVEASGRNMSTGRGMDMSTNAVVSATAMGLGVNSTASSDAAYGYTALCTMKHYATGTGRVRVWSGAKAEVEESKSNEERQAKEEYEDASAEEAILRAAAASMDVRVLSLALLGVAALAATGRRHSLDGRSESGGNSDIDSLSGLNTGSNAINVTNRGVSSDTSNTATPISAPRPGPVSLSELRRSLHACACAFGRTHWTGADSAGAAALMMLRCVHAWSQRVGPNQREQVDVNEKEQEEEEVVKLVSSLFSHDMHANTHATNTRLQTLPTLQQARPHNSRTSATTRVRQAVVDERQDRAGARHAGVDMHQGSKSMSVRSGALPIKVIRTAMGEVEEALRRVREAARDRWSVGGNREAMQSAGRSDGEVRSSVHSGVRGRTEVDDGVKATSDLSTELMSTDISSTSASTSVSASGALTTAIHTTPQSIPHASLGSHTMHAAATALETRQRCRCAVPVPVPAAAQSAVPASAAAHASASAATSTSAYASGSTSTPLSALGVNAEGGKPATMQANASGSAATSFVALSTATLTAQSTGVGDLGVTIMASGRDSQSANASFDSRPGNGYHITSTGRGVIGNRPGSSNSSRVSSGGTVGVAARSKPQPASQRDAKGRFQRSERKVGNGSSANGSSSNSSGNFDGDNGTIHVGDMNGSGGVGGDLGIDQDTGHHDAAMHERGNMVDSGARAMGAREEEKEKQREWSEGLGSVGIHTQALTHSYNDIAAVPTHATSATTSAATPMQRKRQISRPRGRPPSRARDGRINPVTGRYAANTGTQAIDSSEAHGICARCDGYIALQRARNTGYSGKFTFPERVRERTPRVERGDDKRRVLWCIEETDEKGKLIARLHATQLLLRAARAGVLCGELPDACPDRRFEYGVARRPVETVPRSSNPGYHGGSGSGAVDVGFDWWASVLHAATIHATTHIGTRTTHTGTEATSSSTVTGSTTHTTSTSAPAFSPFLPTLQCSPGLYPPLFPSHASRHTTAWSECTPRPVSVAAGPVRARMGAFTDGAGSTEVGQGKEWMKLMRELGTSAGEVEVEVEVGSDQEMSRKKHTDIPNADSDTYPTQAKTSDATNDNTMQSQWRKRVRFNDGRMATYMRNEMNEAKEEQETKHEDTPRKRARSHTNYIQSHTTSSVLTGGSKSSVAAVRLGTAAADMLLAAAVRAHVSASEHGNAGPERNEQPNAAVVGTDGGVATGGSTAAGGSAGGGANGSPQDITHTTQTHTSRHTVPTLTAHVCSGAAWGAGLLGTGESVRAMLGVGSATRGVGFEKEVEGEVERADGWWSNAKAEEVEVKTEVDAQPNVNNIKATSATSTGSRARAAAAAGSTAISTVSGLSSAAAASTHINNDPARVTTGVNVKTSTNTTRKDSRGNSSASAVDGAKIRRTHTSKAITTGSKVITEKFSFLPSTSPASTSASVATSTSTRRARKRDAGDIGAPEVMAMKSTAGSNNYTSSGNDKASNNGNGVGKRESKDYERQVKRRCARDNTDGRVKAALRSEEEEKGGLERHTGRR